MHKTVGFAVLIPVINQNIWKFDQEKLAMDQDNTTLLRTLREFRLRLMKLDPKKFSKVEGQD